MISTICRCVALLRSVTGSPYPPELNAKERSRLGAARAFFPGGTVFSGWSMALWGALSGGASPAEIPQSLKTKFDRIGRRRGRTFSLFGTTGQGPFG